MRKFNLFAIIVLAIGIAVFHSCKKDEELTNNNETKALTSTFNPNEIENMDEYLMGFMKDMKNATRDSEPMTIEDAEWHLSACLNFQFCNANVGRTHVHYDTIISTINVNNGYVSLNDINTSLQNISTAVLANYNSSNLENKNLLYIKTDILDENFRNGAAVKTVVVTSTKDDDFGNYYFDNDSIPSSLFSEGSTYSWKSKAIDTLTYFINVFEPAIEEISGRMYFVDVLTKVCRADKGYSGRMFYAECSYNTDWQIDHQEMAFYLDSYLGLIDSLRPNSLLYIYSVIEPWAGEAPCDSDNKYLNYIHHVLTINYGRIVYTVEPPINEF